MPSGSLITPVGRITIIVAGDRLARVHIGTGDDDAGDRDDTPDALVGEALMQLSAWFEGRLDRVELPLAPAPTPRGEHLRAAIGAVPRGETASYGAVAHAACSSPRAVGQACARNPFPILIPCHRIVGAAGSLDRYSAGEGSVTKRWLLAHERKVLEHE